MGSVGTLLYAGTAPAGLENHQHPVHRHTGHFETSHSTQYGRLQ